MNDSSDEEVYVMAAGSTPKKTAPQNPFSSLDIGEIKVEGQTGEVSPLESQKIGTNDNRTSENSENDQPYELKEVSSDGDKEEKDSYQQNVVGALGSLFLASIVVLAQASQNCENAGKCESWSAYAVALGCVSALISLGLVLGIYCHESVEGSARIDKLMPYLSVFLTIWWGIGVATCTFDGPFENTGNGFFACWIALFLSIYTCQITISKLGSFLKSCKNDMGNPQQRVMGMILVMSFAEAYSCLLQMDEKTTSTSDKASPQEKWGLACSLISAALIIIFLFLEPRLEQLRGQPGLLAYFLVPWWLFGAGVLTFDEPFTATGNGYFCAWGSFIASCYLLYLAQTERTTYIIRTLSNLGSEPIAI